MTELTRQHVLDFIADNPEATSKREIARGLKVKGEARADLRAILKELEDEGILSRVGKRAFAATDNPPPTGIVIFERLDSDGDLIGRASGRDGPFGPDILYAGPSGKRSGGKAPGVGDRALCRIESIDGEWTARMIKLIEAGERRFVGLFTEVARGGRVVSADKKDKHELLIEPGDTKGAEDGDLVRAEARPQRGYGPKRGMVLEVIGKAGDARAASLLAIHAHGIPDSFPDEVLRAAENAEATEGVKRVDLTKSPLITIDPEDARDHDDAVFAAPDEDPKNPGGWKVIVAIADVAAYVRPGEALDREARKRGNSTYFPDRVVPMLPEELSADLCSLREGELRPCMAVEMVFDAEGQKMRHTFMRATMRSAAKLAYEDAQAAIDGRPDDKTGPLLEPVLKPLWAAYETLKKARNSRGPLELDMPERRVWFGEDGKVAGVRVKDRFDAHKLIEEMMIQANVCAAETLEAKRSPLLYRVHDQPTDTKIAALGEFLGTLGIKWTKGERVTPKRFNRLLAQAHDSEHEVTVSEMVLRSQAQAVYAVDNLGHFGLSLTHYAHFTSPIRRYSDLIVHRGLIRALGLGPDGLTDYDVQVLEDTADHLVMTERRSMAAEREANDRYLALFLADRVGAEFDGRVSGVARFGLFVRLTETAADGLVPVSSLGDDYWAHDEAGHALISSDTGKRYELGQEVRVRLSEATPLTGGIILEMLSQPKPARKDQPRKKRTSRREDFRRGQGHPKGKGPKRGKNGRKR
jgi:ribonuclease R